MARRRPLARRHLSLWVTDVDGSHAHEITTGAVRPDWWARWSPDGKRILFALDPTNDAFAHPAIALYTARAGPAAVPEPQRGRGS